MTIVKYKQKYTNDCLRDYPNKDRCIEESAGTTIRNGGMYVTETSQTLNFLLVMLPSKLCRWFGCQQSIPKQSSNSRTRFPHGHPYVWSPHRTHSLVLRFRYGFRHSSLSPSLLGSSSSSFPTSDQRRRSRASSM